MPQAARYFTAAILLFAPTLGHADELRIASWNIANLASGPGISLRGHVRSDNDYLQLADQIRSLKPDIITLQEIGSMPAALRIVGNSYHVAFESRCLTNKNACKADNDDIYTAIAYRTELTDRVTVFQVEALAVSHPDECGGSPRLVRGGVGVKIDIGGQATWVVSVHMKAACRSNSNESRTPTHCATQRAQFNALSAWIKSRPSSDAVIIAGDLNRNLLDPKDRIRNEIFQSISPDVRFLPGEQRTCWVGYKFDFKALVAEARKNIPAFDKEGVRPFIYTPDSYRNIDFFIAINAGPHMRPDADQIYTPSLYRFENPSATIFSCDGTIKRTRGKDAFTFGQAYPSDHCPILLSVRF